VTLVQERGIHAEVLVSCFHRPTIDRVRELDPGVRTAFLHHVVDGTWHDLAADVAAGGHHALHPWDYMVDEAFMEAARAHGLEVNVWTVDDPERMAVLVDLGVHGLCTTCPTLPATSSTPTAAPRAARPRAAPPAAAATSRATERASRRRPRPTPGRAGERRRPDRAVGQTTSNGSSPGSS